MGAEGREAGDRRMMDLIDRYSEALAEHGYPNIKKRFDTLAGREGICIRPLPSTVTQSYYDGTREVDAPFEVIVRRRSEEAAMAECCDIEELLDGMAVPSANGSYRIAGCSVYTASQEMRLDEANYYAWHVRLMAQITTTR